MGSKLSDVKDTVFNLGDTIINGIKDIFVPSEDFLANRVDSIKQKFVFAESIVETVQSISTRISDNVKGTPPKLTMDLDFRGKTKTVTVIDLSWYAKFKSYGDLVLGGAFYVFFAWRMFKNAPNIISGVGSSADTISKL